ncbi:MAG: hypothetical protein IPH22_11080 [Nitrosomonas sp.]|nr:hypothetical protein [Nitrosomonas sp.]
MVNIVKHSPRLGDLARFDPFTNMEDWFKGFGLRPFFNETETAPLIKIGSSGKCVLVSQKCMLK